MTVIYQVRKCPQTLTIFCLAVLSSCSIPGPDSSAGKGNKAAAYDIPNFTFGKELPEQFEAEVEIVTFADGKVTSSSKKLIAKGGGKLFIANDYGDRRERDYLRLADDEAYLIDHQSRAYGELPAADHAHETSDEQIRSRIGGMLILFDQDDAKIEKIGAKDGIDEYSIWLEGDTSVDRYVYFDPKLDRTVRQDTIASGDYGRVFVRRDIKAYSLRVGHNRFKIPQTFRKVVLRKK